MNLNLYYKKRLNFRVGRLKFYITAWSIRFLETKGVHIRSNPYNLMEKPRLLNFDFNFNYNGKKVCFNYIFSFLYLKFVYSHLKNVNIGLLF